MTLVGLFAKGRDSWCHNELLYPGDPAWWKSAKHPPSCTGARIQVWLVISFPLKIHENLPQRKSRPHRIKSVQPAFNEGNYIHLFETFLPHSSPKNTGSFHRGKLEWKINLQLLFFNWVDCILIFEWQCFNTTKLVIFNISLHEDIMASFQNKPFFRFWGKQSFLKRQWRYNLGGHWDH